MGSRTTEYIVALLRYIKDESINKFGRTFNSNDWNLVICDESNTPQQTNDYDCGVFVSMYADFLLDDIPIITFSQSDMPNFRKMICFMHELFHLEFNMQL